jgi:hypothetical protein
MNGLLRPTNVGDCAILCSQLTHVGHVGQHVPHRGCSVASRTSTFSEEHYARLMAVVLSIITHLTKHSLSRLRVSFNALLTGRDSKLALLHKRLDDQASHVSNLMQIDMDHSQATAHRSTALAELSQLTLPADPLLYIERRRVNETRKWLFQEHKFQEWMQ